MFFEFFQHECLGRLRLKCADHIEKEKGEIIANIFNIDPDKPKKMLFSNSLFKTCVLGAHKNHLIRL